MANRPFFRRPRPDGADASGSPPSNGGPPTADGERGQGRRRRRGRGRRGQRPGAAAQAGSQPTAGTLGAAAGTPGSEPREGAPLAGGGEGRRRRRRGGRGRRRREDGAGFAEPILETAEGEVPSDYIAIPVERGMPILYEPRELQEVEEPEGPRKSKRVNSGKLFWYIRSKSYVPIPELRRRFEISPDDMATIEDDGQKMYVGLPQDVADVVANLRRQQKIGLECSADFTAPVVIGIYPLYH